MNKKYNLKLDLQFRCNNSKMIFDEFDENTSDFFMQISRQGQLVDISNTIPTLLVLKPSGTAVSQILNIKDNLIYGNLNNSLKNEVGTYMAKLMLVEGDKKTFISNISYEVTENALLGKIDNDIVEDERYSVLLQLLERLSNIELQEQTRVDNESSRIEAENLRKEIIENFINETNEKIDDFKTDLEEYATKDYVKDEIEKVQFDNIDVDLSNYVTKEELPTKTSQLTNDSGYLVSVPSEYITETELINKGYLTEHQDISHLALKNELFSKDYNDLTNKPAIPSINGLATENYVKQEINKIDVTSQLGDYAKKSDIPVVPTNISAFINDKGYITEIPNEYITEAELNAKGYLTQHQDISGKADKTELHNHTNKTVLDGITSTKVTEWNNKSNLALGTTSSTAYRGDYGNVAYTHSQSTHAPSNAQKNSDITKAEIEAKLTGAITSHTHSNYSLTTHNHDMAYATKSELNSLTLGIHTDGLIYLFKDGKPIGEGLVLNTSTVGYVDDENSIVLDKVFQNGNYTVKYKMEDGTLIDIGVLESEEVDQGEIPTRLPSEYQEVEWVQIINESDRDVTSCVHTNIKWSQVNKIVTKIQHLVNTDDNDLVFAGWQDSEMKVSPYITTKTDEVQAVFGFSSGLTDFNVSPNIATPVNLDANVYTFTFTSATNLDITFGGWNDMIYSNCHKWYYCAFYNGDTLLGEFIPCYRKEDDVNGFYDTVGKQFYTNANSYQDLFLYRGNNCTNGETPDSGETPTETNHFDIKTALLNHRLGSGGSPSAFNGMLVTDYIPVNSTMYGQRFWINGVTLINSSNYNYSVRIIYYDTSKNMINQNNYTGAISELHYYVNSVPNEPFTEGYVRISLVLKDGEVLSESDVSNLTIYLGNY